MRRKRLLAAFALSIVTLPLALAACGGSSETGSASSATTAEAGTESGTAISDFDRAFIDGMVPHHQQAIEMSQAAKDAGLSQPDLVTIADNIIANQQGEIDQMLAWRGEWFGSSEVDPNGADALGLSMEDMGMNMDAGAFSAADDVDALFATMMMDHHSGAIRMAELALERSQREEIQQLAEQIIDAQQKEIEIMMPHASGMDHGA